MAAYGLPVAFDDCCLSARLHGLLYARPSCWRFYLTPRESLSQKLNRDSEREILSGVAREWQRMVCRLHLMIAVFLHV